MRALLLTAPIASLLIWIGVLEIIQADAWLGLSTMAAAAYFLAIPVLFPCGDQAASTANAPPAETTPSTGALEAAPVATLER